MEGGGEKEAGRRDAKVVFDEQTGEEVADGVGHTATMGGA